MGRWEANGEYGFDPSTCTGDGCCSDCATERDCTACDGTGVVSNYCEAAGSLSPQDDECATCEGTGRVVAS